jgi:hypothetical protein
MDNIWNGEGNAAQSAGEINYTYSIDITNGYYVHSEVEVRYSTDYPLHLFFGYFSCCELN